MRAKQKKGSLLLIISTLILGGIIYLADPVAILINLRNIKPVYWILFTIIFTMTTLLRVYRWKLLLSNTKEISLLSLLPVKLAGLAISNLTPGRGGEPVKAFLLKRKEGVPVSKGLFSIVLEKLLDLGFLVILAFYFIEQFSSELFFVNRGVIGAGVLLLLVGIFIIRNEKIGQVVVDISQKTFLKKHLTKEFMSSFYNSSGLTNSTVGMCMLLTSLIWILEAVTFFFALSALGITCFSLGFLTTLLAFAALCGVVSFLPGGLGSTEGVLILILGTFGVSISSIVSGVLIWRFFTLWFVIGFGWLSLNYLGSIQKK